MVQNHFAAKPYIDAWAPDTRTLTRMYIRAKTRILKSGAKATSYALVECHRIKGAPKQRTVLNLGQSFAIPKEQWRALILHIDEGLRGQSRLAFESEGLRHTSETIVEKLLEKGYNVDDPRDDRDAVIIDEVHHTDTRTVGGECVALKALQLLGFAKFLRMLKLREDQIHLATALVVGRMLSPGSERYTHEWMHERSSILELLHCDLPSLSSLYRIGDALYEHRQSIMDALFGTTKELLGFSETIAFFDLTNVFYTGRKKGDLLRHGRSKEKRSDCPLVTLALMIDASGFPRTAEILPGNASEPATLHQAIAQLNGAKPTVIMDAGIATEANLAYLNEQNLDWICVQRTKTPPVPKDAPDQVFKTASDVDVRAWALPDEGGERRVYLHSEARQAVSDQIVGAKRVKFEEAIAHLNAGLALPRRLKNFDKVQIRVGRLIEKYKQVAYQYDVKVTRKAGSTHAEKICLTQRPAYEACTEALGGYVLRTSHAEWSVKKIAQTYWQLGEIERTFRTMKSDLGLRPIYHSRDLRIEAHLFLSILAFHAAHLIRSRLRTVDIHSSWGTLKVKLNQMHRVTTVLPQNATHCTLLKKDQDLKPFHRKVFRAMGLKTGTYTRRMKARRPAKGHANM